jgi:2-methylcitrate dehydratase
MSAPISNVRPPADPVLQQIADYVAGTEITSAEAIDTARYCLMDSIGCALLALKYPDCTKMLGPLVPGAEMKGGGAGAGVGLRAGSGAVRLQQRRVDPLARLQRHLAGGGVGASLGQPGRHSCGGGLDGKTGFGGSRAGFRRSAMFSTAAIKAHEIQGVLALENSFNRAGMDHVILVRIATAAVVTAMLGGDAGADHQRGVQCVGGWRRAAGLPSCAQHRLAQIVGGGRCHQPRRVACADGVARGDGLPGRALHQDVGLPGCAVPRQGHHAGAAAGFSYVMENVLFKIAFPAEFHAQTAVECAFQLHAQVKDRAGAGGARGADHARVGHPDH